MKAPLLPPVRMVSLPALFAAAGLALLALGGVPVARAEGKTPLPPVVERYEQILLKTPEKGTAFDRVYQHFFENDGLEKLAERWKAQRDTASSTSSSTTGTATYELLLGLLYERQGKPAEARQSLSRAAAETLQSPAENTRAWRALGELEAAEGKLPAAIAAFEKALAASDKAAAAEPEKARPSAAERAPLYRQLARSQQRHLQPDAALATWQKMRAEFPDDPFVIEEVAEAQMEAERFGEARASFTRLRELAGADPFKKITATIRLAQVEERQGKMKDALALYESALPQASETSWIHRDVRGRIEEVYRRQDDLPGLVAYYEKWLAAHEKDVEAALRLSAALGELNRKKEATAWVQKAVEWAPDRHELQIGLAKLHNETGQPDAAQVLLSRLTQAHPEELGYWKLLGDTEWRLFKKAGEKPETQAGAQAHQKAAMEAWRRLAPADTKDAARAAALADLFRENALNDEALAEYERAAKLAPETGDFRERWAGFLFDLKRDEEAWKALDGLVAGDLATAANYQRLAAIQLRHGKLDEALASAKAGIAASARGRGEHAEADYSLLALQWRILAERKEWKEAAALYAPMLAAAPTMADQTEQQYLQALRGAEQFDAAQKSLREKAPSASEAELRLLARMALQTDDTETAQAALDEGRKRFPESLALAQLEAALAQRSGNLKGRVEALRRMIRLEPKQAAGFLQEIARAYQEQQQWDEALKVAGEWIAASPANAEAHLFASQLNAAAGRQEAAAGKLREAIRLSEKPNPLRQQLAQLYAGQGESAKARQVMEEAFESEPDATAKLGYLRPLSEFYLQQGKIDTLINRFRERQRGEEGGWRYALYLAEIFQQMQDYGQAREELAKSLASRPKDPALLKQLLQLANQEGNLAEQIRYQKAIAEAEPSAENFAALAESLARNSETEEAAALLQAHESELLKDPAPWRTALSLVQKEPASGPLFAALENSLRRRPDDFQSRMALAELLISLQRFDDAKRTLTELRRMPEPPAPTANTAPANTGPNAGYVVLNNVVNNVVLHRVSIGVSPGNNKLHALYQRLQAAQGAQQSFNELLAPQPAYGGRYYRHSYRSYGGMWGGMQPAAPTAPDFAATRDKALVYLAALALREQKAEAFLADLERELAAQNADRQERLVCYTLVQAREPLLREVAAVAALPENAPADETTDQFCLNLSWQLRNHQNPGAPENKREEELLKPIQERVTKAQEARQQAQEAQNPANQTESGLASLALQKKVNAYHQLKAQGKKEEAQKLFAELTAKPDDPMTQSLLFQRAIEEGDPARAEAMLPRLEELRQTHIQEKRSGPVFYFGEEQALLQAYLQKKDAKNSVRLMLREFAHMLEAIAKPGGPGGPQFYGRFFNTHRYYGGFRRGYRGSYRDLPQLPYPNRFIDENRLGNLQQLSQTLAQLEPVGETTALALFLEGLAKLEPPKDAPAEVRLLPPLAAVYLQWIGNQQEPAFAGLQAILKAEPDDDLRLLAAGMAEALEKSPEAVAFLNAITARQGPVYKQAQQMLLNVAKAANDAENTRKALLRLLALRPAREELEALLPEIKAAGLTEQAGEAETTLARVRPSDPNALSQSANLLNTFVNEKKEKEALALARTILSADPLAGNFNNDYPRRRAMDALRQLKALDDYIADLEKQFAAAPESVRLCLLLAEATENKENHSGDNKEKKALEWWRKLLALKPNDARFQWRLIERLNRNKETREEAMRLCEEMLAKDPAALFENNSHQLLSIYRDHKKLAQLAERVIRQPLPTQGNPNNNPVWFYQNLGEQLKNADETGLAIRVWRRGLELEGQPAVNTYYDFAILRTLLMETLAEQGHREEAAKMVVETLFPPPVPQAAVLGLSQNHYYTNPWDNISTNNDGVMSPALSLLRFAKGLGALEAVKARALERKDDPRMDFALLLIRTVERDPKLLPELPEKWAAPEGFQKLFEGNTFRAILASQELSQWPQARPLALDLLATARKNDPNLAQNTWTLNSLLLQIYRQTLVLGDPERTRAALREWAQNGSMQSMDVNDLMDIAGEMLALGMEKEVEKGLAALKNNPNYRNNNYYREQLEPLESELLLRKSPQARPVQALVAPLGCPPEGGAVTLLWQILPTPKSDNSNNRHAFPSMVSASQNGLWDLELVAVLPDEASGTEKAEQNRHLPAPVRRLAWLPAVNARGMWSGPLPPGAQGVQGILHPAAGRKAAPATAEPAPVSHDGPWAAVRSGSNLLVNPTFEPLPPNPAAATGTGATALTPAIRGWESSFERELQPGGPAGMLVPTAPAPRGKGRAPSAALAAFTQVRLTNFSSSPYNHRKRTVQSEPIPVRPGKVYFLSGWLRLPNNGTALPCVRFFNTVGKEVTVQEVYVERKEWHYFALECRPSRSGNRIRPELTERQCRIPKEAATLRVELRNQSALWLSGLSLIEEDEPFIVPAPTPTPRPTPKSTPWPTPVPTPTPRLVPALRPASMPDPERPAEPELALKVALAAFPLEPTGKEGADLAVAWELRPADPPATGPFNAMAARRRSRLSGEPSRFLTGREHPELDGRYDLELRTASPKGPQRLALLRGVKSRGVWTGRLPEPAGSIEPVLIPADGQPLPPVFLSPAAVDRHPNLIVNPNFAPATPSNAPRPIEDIPGWVGSFAGNLAFAPAPGPIGEAAAVELLPADPKRPALIDRLTLRGEKIPLRRHKLYTFSWWIRGDAEGFTDRSAFVGLILLDRDGEEVGRVANYPVAESGVWSRQSYAYTLTGDDGPEMPAFAQPFIALVPATSRGNPAPVRLHGLRLTESDHETPGEPTPTPTPVPTPTPPPTPTPVPTPVPVFNKTLPPKAVAFAFPLDDEKSGAGGKETGNAGGKGGEETRANTAIAWELRPTDPTRVAPAISPEAQSRRIVVDEVSRFLIGADYPELDRLYDLELRLLTPPNGFRRLALLRGVRSRGVWTGRLPVGVGAVEPVLFPAGKGESKGDKAGPPPLCFRQLPTPVDNLPNLIVNPGFAMEEATPLEPGQAPASEPVPPSADATPSPTATPAPNATPSPTATPAPNATPDPKATPPAPTRAIRGWSGLPTTLQIAAVPGPLMEEGLPNAPGAAIGAVELRPGAKASFTLVGEKIPVRRNKLYALSWWIRAPRRVSTEDIRIQLRFLDGGGREIGNNIHSTAVVEGVWERGGLLVSTAENTWGHRLPKTAAFVQPAIVVSDRATAFALHNLRLSESDPEGLLRQRPGRQLFPYLDWWP